MKRCAYKKCSKMFTPDEKHPYQRFCSPKHRVADHRRRKGRKS